MDLAHALKLALQTGKVRIGVTETLAAANAKQAKLLVVSSTCPDKSLTQKPKFEKIPIYQYPGTAIELGAACGKPFPISALAVVDAGSSAILSLE
ncbi:MAG: 50S ribosomal protein L30e [Thermoplasmata archaeon]|nr:50S ribosomal protein L30e [Thermoplasmata archaeon]MCI4341732.1 50S ribosomal protein L30e [Thermoplasmata archaeon]